MTRRRFKDKMHRQRNKILKNNFTETICLVIYGEMFLPCLGGAIPNKSATDTTKSPPGESHSKLCMTELPLSLSSSAVDPLSCV